MVVTLFNLKKVMTFTITLVPYTTTRTLFAFSGDRLSSVLVNSAAKKYLDFH